MPIDEQLMSQGGFDIPFTADTPLEMRTALGRWDTIVVTSGRIDNPEDMTPAELMGVAVFSGRIDGRELGGPNRPWRLTGAGIGAWLGDAKNAGNYGGPVAGVTPMTSRLNQVFSSFSPPPINSNMISLGTTAHISTNNIDENSAAEESPRTMVERWCGMTDVPTEYRIRPDAVMDFAPASGVGQGGIFPGDPASTTTVQTVVIGRGLTEERNIEHIIYGISDDGLTVKTDWTQYANQVRTRSVGGAIHWSGVSAIGYGSDYTFDGVNIASVLIWYPDLQSDAGTTDLDNLAFQLQTAKYGTRYNYSLKLGSEVWCIADDMVPGARFLLHDPWTDQVDPAEFMELQGAQLSPKTVRCHGYSYPFRPGMGFIGISTCDASNDVTDLSEYVDFAAEPTETTIEVEQQPPTLTEYMREANIKHY